MRQILTLLALTVMPLRRRRPIGLLAVSATVLEVCHVAAVSVSVNKSGVQSNCKYNTTSTVSHEHTTLGAVVGSAPGVVSYGHTTAQGVNAEVMITTVTY